MKVRRVPFVRGTMFWAQGIIPERVRPAALRELTRHTCSASGAHETRVALRELTSHALCFGSSRDTRSVSGAHETRDALWELTSHALASGAHETCNARQKQGCWRTRAFE
ncbi:uncharacterized protein LOC143144803 [Ptiloglossa arizonensis]|uniref:uncharacterized protein LOC143144803 n=1 Tax=Ptiloglossa arizonensis TaxID=3350558 RepID=UPI003FA09F6E